MLHLAQVKTQDPGGKVELRLLAQQKAEHAWAVLPDEEELWLEGTYPVGLLLLIDLSPTRQVQQVQDAAPWVLEMVQLYLAAGITPASLQEELQRAEQWRQSLTLQSQELGRRALEMEARRDQIQELEETLKRDKKKLEPMTAYLKELEEQLKQEKNRLEQMAAELTAASNGSQSIDAANSSSTEPQAEPPVEPQSDRPAE